MSTSDHELMRRCRAGDADAFATLVRRWEPRVARVLHRLAPAAAEVDDLRQEAFIRVFLARTRYRETSEFSTWLYRIVLNLARDAHRRRRPILPLGGHQPADGNGSPDKASQRKEAVELVEGAVDDLPDKLREVLVLKHYGELTFAQMAEVLGQPESTIKSRVQLALRKLHSELKRRGLEDAELER